MRRAVIALALMLSACDVDGEPPIETPEDCIKAGGEIKPYPGRPGDLICTVMASGAPAPRVSGPDGGR
jgi:hypothetical protein